MKVVFIGAVQLSAASLRVTIDSGVEVAGVCTLADSKFNSDHQDLEPIASASEIPCLHVDDINSPVTVSWIKDKNPDVIFCFGWSKLLRHELLKLAPMGVVGFHPAFLPQNRGRHPLIWALALGLKETASTFFFMDDGADSGDILSQKKVFILDQDNAFSLYDKISETALGQIREFIPRLINGSYERIKQNHSNASYWRKRGVKDGEIDWRMPAEGIYNLVRALSKPYVGAHFLYKEREVKVWDSLITDLSNVENIEAGKVLSIREDGFCIKCGDKCLTIKESSLIEDLEEGCYL